MRILFIGDVVGQPGRRILASRLPSLRDAERADLVIVNGENAAGGAGLTPATADELFAAGADVITSGNHIWDRREILPYLETHPRLLRPANYPGEAPGSGVCRIEARDGTQVAVLNLIGRVFLANVDDPFRTADQLIADLGGSTPVVFVDFHAEATSEKTALGWYLDGRVSAVVGTHTHVPTADERILPRGTAYLTDAGMTGPHDSVIGVETQAVVERFLSQRPIRYTTAQEPARMDGVTLEVDAESGKAREIRRVRCFEAEGPAC